MKKKTSKTKLTEAKAKVNVEAVVRRFTYEEVKNILCEGCRLNVSSLRICDEQKWYHTLNGNQVLCMANDWRNKNA